MHEGSHMAHPQRKKHLSIPTFKGRCSPHHFPLAGVLVRGVRGVVYAASAFGSVSAAGGTLPEPVVDARAVPARHGVPAAGVCRRHDQDQPPLRRPDFQPAAGDARSRRRAAAAQAEVPQAAISGTNWPTTTTRCSRGWKSLRTRTCKRPPANRWSRRANHRHRAKSGSGATELPYGLLVTRRSKAWQTFIPQVARTVCGGAAGVGEIARRCRDRVGRVLAGRRAAGARHDRSLLDDVSEAVADGRGLRRSRTAIAERTTAGSVQAACNQILTDRKVRGHGVTISPSNIAVAEAGRIHRRDGFRTVRRELRGADDVLPRPDAIRDGLDDDRELEPCLSKRISSPARVRTTMNQHQRCRHSRRGRDAGVDRHLLAAVHHHGGVCGRRGLDAAGADGAAHGHRRGRPRRREGTEPVAERSRGPTRAKEAAAAEYRGRHTAGARRRSRSCSGTVAQANAASRFNFTTGGKQAERRARHWAANERFASGPVDLLFAGVLGVKKFEPQRNGHLDPARPRYLPGGRSLGLDDVDTHRRVELPTGTPNCGPPHPTRSRWGALATSVDAFSTSWTRPCRTTRRAGELFEQHDRMRQHVQDLPDRLGSGAAIIRHRSQQNGETRAASRSKAARPFRRASMKASRCSPARRLGHSP